jgi:hypothetical protein
MTTSIMCGTTLKINFKPPHGTSYQEKRQHLSSFEIPNFPPYKIIIWSCLMSRFFEVNFIAVQIEYYFGVKYILLGRVRLSSNCSLPFGVVHEIIKEEPC